MLIHRDVKCPQRILKIGIICVEVETPSHLACVKSSASNNNLVRLEGGDGEWKWRIDNRKEAGVLCDSDRVDFKRVITIVRDSYCVERFVFTDQRIESVVAISDDPWSNTFSPKIDY